MDHEILELLNKIMDNMATKDDLKGMVSKDDLKASEERTNSRLLKLEMQIENNVSKKIEALFDGYKLTHEKQWELERRVDKLEAVIEELRNKIA